MRSDLLSIQRETIAPLEEVMAFEHPDIVPKFRESWDVPVEEAEEYFMEMKRWLWLSANSIFERDNGEEVPALAIGHSMLLLDEMWHTFILFTMDYQKFCFKYFGFYLNHGPTPPSEKVKMAKELEEDPKAFQEKIETDFRKQYSYIYDHLGEATLVRWYSEWTDRITTEYLDTVHKPYWK